MLVEAQRQGGKMNKTNKWLVTCRLQIYIHTIQLTCCSVQDLGLKEYAGVLVSDAGEEQPLGLHWTTRYHNLQST